MTTPLFNVTDGTADMLLSPFEIGITAYLVTSLLLHSISFDMRWWHLIK